MKLRRTVLSEYKCQFGGSEIAVIEQINTLCEHFAFYTGVSGCGKSLHNTCVERFNLACLVVVYVVGFRAEREVILREISLLRCNVGGSTSYVCM